MSRRSQFPRGARAKVVRDPRFKGRVVEVVRYERDVQEVGARFPGHKGIFWFAPDQLVLERTS